MNVTQGLPIPGFFQNGVERDQLRQLFFCQREFFHAGNHLTPDFSLVAARRERVVKTGTHAEPKNISEARKLQAVRAPLRKPAGRETQSGSVSWRSGRRKEAGA